MTQATKIHHSLQARLTEAEHALDLARTERNVLSNQLKVMAQENSDLQAEQARLVKAQRTVTDQLEAALTDQANVLTAHQVPAKLHLPLTMLVLTLHWGN